MCGIVGAWIKGRRESAAEGVIRGMSALRHRGPDDDGLIEIEPEMGDTSLVLGHRRLSIIDLSEGGHQPMRDPETGNWIIYNGEIYNFKDIRAELEKHGCRFRSDSDTEVILQSYRIWGRDCVERWRGMFAAAIWDEGRQELFLVRDRLGIKPLYYAYRPGHLIFGSEIRALLATGFIRPEINPAAVNTYLTFGAVQDPLTLIEGIASLPAAHTLTVKENGIELKEYWELPLEGSDGTRSAAEASDELSELLEESVRLRLISDVPLGVFLSGGVDSSALCLLMARTSKDQVRAFTVNFEDNAFDEGKQAQQTARELGVEYHPIWLTESEMLASYDNALKAFDQPSIDGINTYFVSRSVKQAGITVALSGLGGDEVFCGYPHFRTIPRLERVGNGWNRLPSGLRRAGASILRLKNSDKKIKLHSFLLNDYGFEHPYFLSRTLLLPNQVEDLVRSATGARIDYGAWEPRMKLLMQRARNLDPVNRVSYLELKTYLANMLLRDADVMSMAHSLEVRVPLLDHRLLEKVLPLRGNLKLDSVIPKPLLVRSLRGSLPDGVIKGPKRGFVLPYENWLRGKLLKQVQSAFDNPPAALENIIDANSAQAVWQSFLNGRCNWARPWALFVLYHVVSRLVADTKASQLDYQQRGAQPTPFVELQA